MTIPPAPAERPANFFGNFNRLVGVAYATIVAITIGFFLHQIYQKRAEEIATIEAHVERHGLLTEFVLRNSVDYLEASRVTALNFYADTPADSFLLRGDEQRPTVQSKLFSQIRTSDDGSRFHLDKIAEPDSTGNLTGDGRIEWRTPAFYRDVEMATDLAQDFQAINLNLPNAVSSRFIAVEKFSYVFPWQESSKERFTLSDYRSPTWEMGTPEADPTHEKYWPPVFYAGKDKGLLASVAAPIYDGNTFRGILSIETSLDYLNRLNDNFGYPLGTVMLVDANQRVLAHPKLFADPLNVQEVPQLAEALPQGIDKDELLALPARMPVEISGNIVIRYPFLNAPWNLVYILPSSELTARLWAERGIGMLAVIASLTLLMLITYYVTAREFIAPASKLVQHIAAESQFETPPIPTVPSAWRPWFERISIAFKESIQLVGIRQELDIAAKMQLSILPRDWPQRPEFALWGTMHSAKEVGGDFYDHFQLPGDRIGIVCADVSGKGVPAALFGMVSKTLIRAICTRSDVAPAENIATVNDILSEDNDSCVFVTTFYGVFDPHDGILTYVNAGHPPPLLVHADGSSEFLATTKGIALGVFGGATFIQATLALAADDYLFVYTDGVTEAFNAQNEEFTPERLSPIFNAQPPTSVDDGVQRIIDAVNAHANGAPQSDDITCVALKSNVVRNATSTAVAAAQDSSGVVA